ncbi:MAG: PIG-L deacetylase family protein [Anaerolineaceae bacterium]
MSLLPEKWETPKKILVVLAHPDDPEFFLGGTIARWCQAGHTVEYCLLTRGDKGTSDPEINPQELMIIRENEEIAAAGILGVHSIEFLDFLDGYLVPDLAARKAVSRVIRRHQPDILVSCDPTNIFPNENYINHPDHRAAGQISLDAVFPTAGNPMFFRELMDEEGLMPHSVEEVWLSLTCQPNVTIDVTEFWDQKIQALYEHKTQIGDKEAFTTRMKSRFINGSTMENPRYEENFKRIVFLK